MSLSLQVGGSLTTVSEEGSYISVSDSCDPRLQTENKLYDQNINGSTCPPTANPTPITDLSSFSSRPSIPLVTSYFNSSSANENDGIIETKKANLGMMIGVYLPTVQHIIGAMLFLRLFWIVGIMGILQSFFMVFLCCLCTFLTCISLSAVVTNGVIESGGAYFMISRNLGPEFGTAVGVLFYLANACASSMYIVGGIEILLLYIAPSITIGESQAIHDAGFTGIMSNNIRIYGTILLLIMFLMVALGVKFVQFFAPFSLFCVIISILAIFAGSVYNSVSTSDYTVCYMDGSLLDTKAYVPDNVSAKNFCAYCYKNNQMLIKSVCPKLEPNCTMKIANYSLTCLNAFPGISNKLFKENLLSTYLDEGESLPGKMANRSYEVFQDISTSFFILLAIFFPSVTGIMTGANMSGDLRDSQKSVPIGTIAAQVTTTLIYILLLFAFGTTIAGPVLRDKYGKGLGGSGMVVAEMAWPNPWIILIGSFISCFGAGLQCLCSAPRLLQSIAKDEVLPFLHPLAKLTDRNEPFRCTVVTTILAELMILVAAVDKIAPVVDFFFLMCYAFVNLICALHSLLGAPNWRPRFKYYHWSLSLLASFICFFIMFSTHWIYAIVVILLCAIIYKYVEWKGDKKEWGDGIRGLVLSTAQFSLSKLEDKQPHPKNWRPQILLIANLPQNLNFDKKEVRKKMLHLASQLKKGKGLTIVVSLQEGNPTDNDQKSLAAVEKAKLSYEMTLAKVRGFCSTLVYEEDHLEGALSTLIQSSGIGPLRPNTLLLPYPENDHNATDYWYFIHRLQRGAAQDMSLLIAKGILFFPALEDRISGEIDVWWILHDGGLLLLISFLLKQHKVWKSCKMRIFVVVHELDDKPKMKVEMERFLYEMRIDAELYMIEFDSPDISAYEVKRTSEVEKYANLFNKRPTLESILVPHRKSRDISVECGNSSPDFSDGKSHSRFVRERVETRTQYDEYNRAKGIIGEPFLSVPHKVQKPDVEELKTLSKRSSEERGRHYTFSQASSNHRGSARLSLKKVEEMHSAVHLNAKIVEMSYLSALIVLNLPEPPKNLKAFKNYMNYLDVLTYNLKRVLFVRGTGKEVITIY